MQRYLLSGQALLDISFNTDEPAQRWLVRHDIRRKQVWVSPLALASALDALKTKRHQERALGSQYAIDKQLRCLDLWWRRFESAEAIAPLTYATALKWAELGQMDIDLPAMELGVLATALTGHNGGPYTWVGPAFELPQGVGGLTFEDYTPISVT